MKLIEENLLRVEERVAAACRAAARARAEVRLVAVCKNFGAERVREAAALGQTEFGENRLQEAEPKIAALAGLGLKWHFVGRIQTNKLNRILESFETVQSLDRVEVLDKAERFLAERNLTRDGLLEVHISGEGTKAGFEPDALRALIASGGLTQYPHLNIRGLMGIGPLTPDRSAARRSFDLLKTLYDEGRAAGLPWNTLSMGMSADLEEAIAAGSTMVRIGSALFGPRPA